MAGRKFKVDPKQERRKLILNRRDKNDREFNLSRNPIDV